MAEQHTASRQTILIRLTVNGHGHEVAVEPHETLIELIRDHLGLTGTKNPAICRSAAPARYCSMAAR